MARNGVLVQFTSKKTFPKRNTFVSKVGYISQITDQHCSVLGIFIRKNRTNLFCYLGIHPHFETKVFLFGKLFQGVLSTNVPFFDSELA